MSLCIVIPMKDPQYSKQRLSDVLAPDERQCVALNLLNKTLGFLNTHFADYDVLIVTPSTLIAEIARQYQVKVLLEPQANGLNDAITQGAQYCQLHGYKSVLVLPADIIDLCIHEFESLLNKPRPDDSVIICPADDGGTNALLCTPPMAIDFNYGIDSCSKHWHNAKRKGYQCELLTLPSLALDLDTAQDLQQLSASAINQLKLNTLNNSIKYAS